MERGPHRREDRRSGSEQRVLGARETSREELRAQRRGGESGRSAGGVCAHRHPGLVTDREEEEGEGRRRASRPRGEEGERQREAPLGLFPAGLQMQSVFVQYVMNGWLVTHYLQLFNPFHHKKKKKKKSPI